MLAVLNEGGRDRLQMFPEGAGKMGEAHPPVNYHAYAACVKGGFYQFAREVPEGVPVLLLLRKDWKSALRALRFLRERGQRVFVSFKESGAYQVAGILGRWGAWESFAQICREADGALSSTADLVPLYQAAGARKVMFLPTPYPVGEEGWEREEEAERRGIFLGTREFDVASRNHRQAVEIACKIGEETGRRVTLIDNGSVSWWLRKSLGGRHGGLCWVKGPLPYGEYLRLMGGHEAVFQLDRSVVPGQVAGDAVLARVLCIGGDGAIDRLVFSKTSGYGRDVGELAGLLRKVLVEPDFRSLMEEEARKSAMEWVSFGVIAPQLLEFFSEK